MNKKSTFQRLAATVLVMFLCLLPLMAQQNTRRPSAPRAFQRGAAPLKITKANGEAKYAYGVLGFDYDENTLVNTLVEFPFVDGATFTPVKYLGQYEDTNGYDVTAGAYADGYYYAELTLTDPESDIMMPVALVRYDIDTDELTTVGALTGFFSHINDMAYDYSTKTMYAISVKDGSYSTLYSIDLATAKSTPVAPLDRRFFTLACTYDGQLYGISFDGDLCKIDKTEGDVEVVGATGWHPTYYQSMEFDHTDETLYWAANLIEGTDEHDCIASVDLATGAATAVAAVGNLPQLAGLYVPFSASAKGTPAAVTGFTAVPDAQGANKAVLSWTNPTATFDGQTLNEITEVKIYRDHQLVKTLTGMAPGAKCSFTDEMEGTLGKRHSYVVVAVNAVGDGAEARTRAFVGHDVPAAVTDLTLTVDDNEHATLSWNQPQEGAQGGYVDHSSLTYTVTRSDGKTVARNLKDTHVTDYIIKAQLYTYSVVAVNADGQSTPVQTAERALGPVVTLPAVFDFNAAVEDNSWTIVNDNSSDAEAGWYWTDTNNGNAMGHRPSGIAVSDDWLMGYYMPFEKGETYRIDIDYMAYGRDKVEIFLLRSLDKDQPLQQIATMEPVYNNATQHYSATFNAQETGNFSLALHAASPVRADWLYLYKLTVRKAESVNLAARTVSGNATPLQGEENVYTVTLANDGKQDVTAFSVSLKDQNGAELVKKDFEQTIKSGATADVQLSWTPQTTDTKAVYAEVEAEGDEFADDNKSGLFHVSVREPFNGNMASLGLDSKYQSVTTPFAFSWQYAAAQNIYLYDEINASSNQNIVKVAWPYDATEVTEDMTDVPVRVYMANTERVDNLDKWIPESEYTLVYDGTVSLPKESAGELNISLTKPFLYEKGKNLAVLTVVNTPKYYRIKYKAYVSPNVSNYSYQWTDYSAETWFDFTQEGHGDYLGENSSVVFYMTDAPTGIVSVSADALAGNAYTVFDLSGRKVAEGTFAADGSVDTTPLQRGTYVIGAKVGGKQQSMKISVNK